MSYSEIEWIQAVKEFFVEMDDHKAESKINYIGQ